MYTLQKYTWIVIAVLGALFLAPRSARSSTKGESIVGTAIKYTLDRECLDVNVKDFGAKGDGQTDDRIAIQAAVDYALTNSGADGAAVYFPAGCYMVTPSINVSPGSYGLILHGETNQSGTALAVLTLESNQSYSAKLMTTHATGYIYSGTNDSPLLDIHNLEFDGNRHNQGEYLNWEKSRQSCVILVGNSTTPGRLSVRLDNCYFHDSCGDGVTVWNNVKATLNNLHAHNMFRNGICLTGVYVDLSVKNYLSTGVLMNGFKIEYGGTPGYGGSLQVKVKLSDLDIRHCFTMETLDGGQSEIYGDNITVREAFFGIHNVDCITRLSNCKFGVPSTSYQCGVVPVNNRILKPENVTFVDCTFTPVRPEGDTGTVFRAVHIEWGGASCSNQTLLFDNCHWTLGDGVVPDKDICTAIYEYGDSPALSNWLVLTGDGSQSGNRIDPGYTYGVYLDRGGSARLKGTKIGALTGLFMNHRASSQNLFLNVVLDSVSFLPQTITAEHIHGQHPSNSIEHINMILADDMNTLGTMYGLVGNNYQGARRIQGIHDPSKVLTPGFVGDMYNDSNGNVWVCTKTHHVSATWVPAP